jgi:regulator of protease activity HflC (stomatin/prohibitin superfamily)
MTLAVLVAVVVVLVLVGLSVKVVPANTAFVLERLGAYSRTLGSGLAFVVPVVDRVRARVSLVPQRLTLSATRVTAADGSWISVRPEVVYAVVDPVAATYEVASFQLSLEQLATTALRKLLSGMESAAAVASRDELGAALLDVLGEAAAGWGLRIDEVEVASIERARPPR